MKSKNKEYQIKDKGERRVVEFKLLVLWGVWMMQK